MKKRDRVFIDYNFAISVQRSWLFNSAPRILQASRRFTCVTAHSPTLPSLYLHHSSFTNPSVALPTSHLILQPFFRFSYVRGFHLRHLASRPWCWPYFMIHNSHRRKKKSLFTRTSSSALTELIIVQLKEKNYILNRDLNPGLYFYVLVFSPLSYCTDPWQN